MATKPNGPGWIEQHELNNIKKVIAVMSGKGGVGKSTVTGLLAAGMARVGNKTGILDADITGPSIPKIFGLSGRIETSELGMFPVKTSKLDIEIMSINLLLEREDQPVIWRGPLIAGTVRQFWTDVIWGELDYLFVDLPPGTGDAPLTVLQSLPLSGIVIVSSPQDLAVMVVKKAVNMVKQLDIPVLGLIENMSYAICPDCGKKLEIFGRSRGQEAAASMGIPYLGGVPIDSELAELSDAGRLEDYENETIASLSSHLFSK
ncbi:MAG: Mrp/NBP35 family ATP-binding protein [Halanaerobium sp.]|nr:Mrp/NBP35 family ATP-binding protein [Halanaerobium sp.]